MVAKNTEKAQNKSDKDLLDILLGEGGQELRLERTIYAADECGDVPLVGFYVDLLDMPPIKTKDGMRDWKAFVVEVTHKTKGKDRNGDIVDVNPGEEVITVATHQLAAALGRMARDPEVMHEIGLKPKEKIDIGDERTMWTYRVIRVSRDQGKTFSIKKRDLSYALIDKKVEPKQLGTTSSGEKFDSKTGEVAPGAS